MSEERIIRTSLDFDNPPPLTEDEKRQLERLRQMTDEEVHAAALADPDNPPMTEEELRGFRRVPNPRAIREKLGMTQEDFAEAFDLTPGIVRRWESHPWALHQPERVLLRLIESIPDVVREALR